jgi:conjugative transfer signal peptidase TraF
VGGRMIGTGLRQALIVATASLLFATNVVGLTYNTTPSLPVGLYRIRTLGELPLHGAVVGFCLEGEAARTGLARGYVHPEGLEPIVYGMRCSAGTGIIGKPVAGVPGDTIDVAPEGVRINGTLLRRSRVPTHDRRGRPLTGTPWGRTILRAGDYWLQSEYAANSYDSRLYGPVRIERILDRRVLILPLGPGGLALLAAVGLAAASLFGRRATLQHPLQKHYRSRTRAHS